MALSGVRSSWLMVARKRLFALLVRSDSLRAISSARSCTLRSVTSRSTATTSRSPEFAASAARSSGRQRISIQTKWPPWGSRVAVAADAEFDRAVLAERGRIGERGEIGRPVGDMHAVEQAVAGKLAGAHAEQRLGRRRDEQHGAVAAMPGDDVGHVAREQAIAVLLGIEQPDAGARELLGAERETGGVERGGDDAERGQRAMLVRHRVAGGSRPSALKHQQQARRRRARRSTASATTRREAESAASSGTTTSQIAANEPMPPVHQATTATRPVSESEDSTCALS